METTMPEGVAWIVARVFHPFPPVDYAGAYENPAFFANVTLLTGMLLSMLAIVFGIIFRKVVYALAKWTVKKYDQFSNNYL